MHTYLVATLRGVIGVALVGSVGMQALFVSLLWSDVEDARMEVRVPFVALVCVGILALQVIGVCVWRLLTMVRRGTVFSFGAFRYVDLVIGAIGVGSAVVFGLAVLAAYSNRTTPGDEVAPGVVGMICGISLVIAGVALVVYVMKTLLRQAVALDDETKHLQAELDEVI